ncbi:HAD family hydrolase [Roseateles microcysteis]|uniref:HAD family hydrolase n=1 Tax=Roseateles microcysteis TaxID=3119057 RepID=UPI002FE6367E
MIALDADGVLLDYSAAYAGTWARAFGVSPVVCNPDAYWPMDRWGVARLEGPALERFRASFDEEFWSTVPPIEGALEACSELVGQGFELVCVTALASRFRQARIANLRTLGFPLSDVLVVEDQGLHQSPKADVIKALNPLAFVDDYLPYFRGMPGHVHKALIVREPDGSPNAGPELSIVDSQHKDLRAFSNAWATRRAGRAGKP